ncbi:MAG: hypothetical protein ACO36A_04775 [Ilumatobacteraceae bacterium]
MALGWRFVIVASIAAMCAAVVPNVRFATAVDDSGDTGGGPASAPLLLVVSNR